MTTGLRRERVRASRQWRDGAFRNPSGLGPALAGDALPLLREYALGDAEREPRVALPLLDPRPVWQRPPESGLRVTWLGHSTLLVELDGTVLLTDPVFGERASPLPFAGPRRFHPVPAPLEALPPIDAVVLSHDHYDHLCAPTVRQLARRGVPFVTSLGVGATLERLGVEPARITELDWGEATQVRSVELVATEAQHFSGRGLADRNRSLWSAFVLRGERHRCFFSGDTGLTAGLSETAARYGPFDLVALEVGAFHPAWGAIHLGPAQALTAFEWLGGGALLPVHWGTFNLALHAWHEPAETLLSLAAPRDHRILTPRLGGSVEPGRETPLDPWWRPLVRVTLASESSPEPA